MPSRSLFSLTVTAFTAVAIGIFSGRYASCEEGHAKLFRAGAYAIDVTPEQFPVLVNGGMYSRTSESIVDRLHARCLVLDDGVNQIAIVVVDSCMAPRDLLDDAKQLAAKATKIPTERMLISATHTHSAPAAMGCLGTDRDERYARFLPARIARGIQLAQRNLEPARIGWASGRDPDNVYCRRFLMKEGTARTNPFSGKTNDRAQMNPGHNNSNAIERTGVVDDEVFVLSVQAKDGRPIALLANYSTHYAGAPALSADYFGVFAENITKHLKSEDVKPAFVGIMSNGTSGDANCLDFTRGDRRKFDRFTVAEDTAKVAFEAYQNIKYYDWAPIVMAEGLLELNVRMPTVDQVAEAKQFLATDEGKALRSVPAVYAREAVILSELPPTRELKLQAIRIGPLGITAIPNEVYGSTGLALKNDSPLKPTFNIELANGAEGYIPPPDQHKLGGYTTWRARTSCLEEEAEPKIRAKLVELLHHVAKERIDEQPQLASGERKLPESATPEENDDAIDGESNQEAHAPRSPLSPEDSLKYLHVRPGMKVELVAAEPLIRDPVAFDWGPDGKLWVVEYLDYPTGIDSKGTGGGRIVYLEDTDADGRYDKSTLFIDQLNFPTGVMAWRNGVLITAAPDILFAHDTNDDGKADKVEKLYTGFHEANQQLRVNGLRWGLDGWIYCASGSHHGNYGAESKIKSTKTGELVHIGARDFRIKPDEGLIEPVSGPSQFGRNRDAWGNWFGTQNAKPMFHYVLEDRYLRRNPHVAPPPSQILISDVPGQRPVFPRSTPGKFHHASQAGRFTSANSAMIYGDELLGKDFIGNSFVSEPVHNLVHREIVERNGVTFKSRKPKDEEQTEFLASEDTWFRPTTIRTGPDGALWVADMYREIIEHPRWVSDDLKPIVDTRSGNDRGRIYRIYPEGAKPRAIPRIEQLKTKELVALLESPSVTLRDMAQMQIATREPGEAAAPLMKIAQQGERPESRYQAMWTLHRLGKLSPELVRAAAESPHQELRRGAVHLAEGYPKLATGSWLGYVGTKKGSSPAVAMQAAFTAGELDDPLMGDRLLIIAMMRQDDPYVVAAALSSLDGPKTDRAIVQFNHHKWPVATPSQGIIEGLIESAIGYQRWDTLADLIKFIATPIGNEYAPWQLNALAYARAKVSQPMQPYSPRLDLHDESNALHGRVRAATDFARDQLSDVSDVKVAIASMNLIVSGRMTEADESTFTRFLSPEVDGELQAATVAALSRTSRPIVAKQFLKNWKGHTPPLRSQILDALLSRGPWTESLLASVEAGEVAAADISAAQRQRLLKSGNPNIRQKATAIFAGDTDPDRVKVIGQYQGVIGTISKSGNVVRGLEVFKQRCSACHKVDVIGNEVGPDLKGLTDKSPGNLLASILDPNRAVEPKYVSYQAVTTVGRIYNGMLADESGGSLTLLDGEGKKHLILRRDLDELTASGKSLMPEGLEKDISTEQMRDLLAYLSKSLNAQ